MHKTPLLKQDMSRVKQHGVFAKKIYGIVVLTVVTIQLFLFEELMNLVDRRLVGGEFTAYLLSAVTVIFGVMALPYLMGMKTSTYVLRVSMVVNFLLILQWLSLPYWLIK